MAWPPTLLELKLDLKIDATDTREDARLAQVLDAAVDFTERVRTGFAYDPLNPDQFGLPQPTADLRLGTLRLAGRWHIRRRSPDGMVSVSAEMGSARVASFDADIDRLLGIGRHRKSVIA
jgi:hypothetical protein